jgi:DNA polymerase III subunit epsilon
MQLAFTTADELARLLNEAGEPLDYREIWPRVFAVVECPPDLMKTLADDLVNQDQRFVWESSVHIGLSDWRASHRDLGSVAFTVVDLETTGATPGFAKITEIGAVRVQAGEIVATFSQLIDPCCPIPPMIVGLTGITRQMVAGKPTIEAVLPAFVRFCEGSVMVAHNARFDLGFLDYELGILNGRTFPRPVLDTLRLARRLTTQQRCSLSALSERFCTAAKPCHRALDDAQATAELLLMFLAQLQEDGMTTLEDVVRFCEPESRRNYHKIVLTEKLPAVPGVYIMRDDKGAPLYIGKAESLRRRTRDHFLQKQAYGARQALELLDHIDIIETGSEFEALLLEGRLIAAHKPPYNERGTRASSYHYVKLTSDAYPRLYATPNHIDDGSLYAGPFRSQTFARRLVESLTAAYPLRTCARLVRSPGSASCARYGMGACLGPCQADLDGTYTDVVAKVRRALEGDTEELDQTLQVRMTGHAACLQYEQAARVQDLREAIAQATRVLRRLREAAGTWAVLIYPGHEQGEVNLWGVAGGSVVQHEVAAAGWDEQAAAAFLDRLLAWQPPRPPLPAGDIDEVLLVDSWLHHNKSPANVLRLRHGGQTATSCQGEKLASELAGRVAACGAPPR